jgi:hypothetical protein
MQQLQLSNLIKKTQVCYTLNNNNNNNNNKYWFSPHAASCHFHHHYVTQSKRMVTKIIEVLQPGF